MSFAIARGKVPVCISPSFGDRWLSPKVYILVYRRSLYVNHRYSRWCWFLDEGRGAQGAFYGRLGEIGYDIPDEVDTLADSGKSGNLFSGLIMISMAG